MHIAIIRTCVVNLLRMVRASAAGGAVLAAATLAEVLSRLVDVLPNPLRLWKVPSGILVWPKNVTSRPRLAADDDACERKVDPS